ncbi:L-type lectin-domain containing receptor kinase SIT2-like [Cornus florida]|uniref:L-type lectin-domain containing receptor kinase SIT2-like n=1 Tax=Cornus florida TaxID=4283 RepID=UPI0028A27517|nr:L-type lectin-domain containing receptor kinase SIT2-like [Cornus florida]
MRNLFLLLFSMNITLTSLLFLILFSLPIKLLALTQAEDQFIYHGFGGTNLHLNGSAKIHHNGLLQLTTTSNQQIGNAFYQFPLKFNTSSSSLTRSLSFSTTLVFAIIPNLPNDGGHGMAFTISPSMDFSHAMHTEFLGLLNTSNNGQSSNHLLAVEFDTVQSLDVADIDGNHVGIDVNSLKSNVSTPVTYISNSTKGVKQSLELVSGNAIQVWIDYDEVEKLLNITLAPIKTPKPIRPLLSTALDLSLVLLDSMYVCFSAATGSSATSNHYVLGWSFNRKGQAQELELSKLPSFPRHRKSRVKIGLYVTVSLITVSMVLIFIAITWTVYVTRRKRYEELREDWEQEYGPQRFSYEDLHKATNGFKDRELLGAGGFGKVYRGVLPSSSKEIAVKKVSHGSIQGMKEFVSEIASMGRLRHRNLVQLLGYCRRRGELLLVYDYMPNESLDKFLFSNEKPNLDWAQRYQIIKGVASALLYLHEEWEQVVIHRDVKASNVLLDADLNGRLGDFGLARLCDHGANPQITDVVGTVGYIAPELTRTGQATTFTDVFAFGAFMLEVACGRRPVEPQRLPRERILVDWVFERWKQRAILETIDPRLGGDYAVEEMEFILKVGLLFSHSNPVARPSMRQVIQYLNGDVFPEILLERAEIGMVILGHGATADFVMSTFSLSSNESILIRGR